MTVVAVLGTGTMGAGMARSARREGLDVRVWNRDRSRAEPLASDGITVADSPAEAVQGADVVVTMLFDAEATLAVLGRAAGAVGPDTVVLQSATVGLEGARTLAGFAAQHGLTLLDAPVLGTRGPAENGKLVFLVGGDESLRPAVTPVLEAMGARTIWAGPESGAGTSLKLACNAWVAAITAAAAQSLALARGLGLDPQLFLDAIEGQGADSPYAHVKGATMLAGQYPVQFALDGVRKDVGLIGAAIRAAGVAPTLNDAVRSVYDAASQAGHGGEDIAAVFTAFDPSA